MNRTIKFRAWDKGRKQMHPVTRMLFHPTTGELGVLQLGEGEPSFPPDQFIPMQFTGLHDAKGREIYEGDIVTFHAFGFDGSETEYEGKGMVTYRPDGMCFVIAETDRDWLVDETSHFGEPCIEVIGNVFENSDLLV